MALIQSTSGINNGNFIRQSIIQEEQCYHLAMDFVRQLKPLLILDAILATGAILVVKSLASLVLSRKSPQVYKLPPGPKPLPLVGNLLDLPKDHDWVHWAKHKDVYGPISSVTVFNQTIIILNDVQATIDLFEKRSNIYSDRPILTFAGEMSVFPPFVLQYFN